MALQLGFPWLFGGRLALAVLLALSVGCGDDDAPPAGTDAGRDAGRDAGEDAGDDGGEEDASADTGSEFDAGSEECAVTPLDISLDPISGARAVSVNPSVMGFDVVWGQTEAGFEDVYRSTLIEGNEPMTARLTNDPGSARNVYSRDGLIVWEDDLAELSTFVIRSYPAASGSGADIIDISNRDRDARNPVVTARAENAWIIAYFEQEDDNWVLRTRALNDEDLGSVNDIVEMSEPTQIALSASDGAPVLGYNEGGDLKVVALTEAGAADGEPNTLSTEGNAVGPVDLAFHESGGIVVFEVSVAGRPELRSRLLNADGSAKREEQVVSMAPGQGRNPRAITFSGGFGIVYHERLLGMEPATSVQLAFVHGSDGNVVVKAGLGTSGFDDGLPGVGVNAEGAIVAGWAELIDEGTQIRAAQISCETAWLRCSPMEEE